MFTEHLICARPCASCMIYISFNSHSVPLIIKFATFTECLHISGNALSIIFLILTATLSDRCCFYPYFTNSNLPRAT